MRTPGTAAGAVGRAAVAGVAAGLLTGLAACGTTVAGTGTAASRGAATPAAADGAAAAPEPSRSGVNPGGVMTGPGPSKDAALCQTIPKLTRMISTFSPRPPGLHVRAVQPAGFSIRDAAAVRRLAALLCALPSPPGGRLMCPDMTGASYRAFFAAGGRFFPVVTVEMSGCRVVTGLGPVRSWSASTALGQALSQQVGAHLPLAPDLARRGHPGGARS